jgi:hypothetical protein
VETAIVRLITEADPELLERFRERLATDGEPSIEMSVGGAELVISAETAPIMLRSRVVAAIEDVAGDQARDMFRPA